MVDLFTDADERRALVDNAAAEMGVAPWVIEKDLWVCWMLARLQEIPQLPALTFKGGTSLSKVHGLIDRFSEDIDLTFSREGWGFDGERDPMSPGLSGQKRRKLIDEIAAQSAQVVATVAAPGFEEACRRGLGGAAWSVDISPTDPQAVLFAFPTPAAGYGYGQPVVKAEFGARGEPWPTAARPVVPYLEQLYEGTAGDAITDVATLEPERTFWEKATLLHALHHGTLEKPDKRVGRLSRHLYDVHRIWHSELRGRLLVDRSLLEAVVAHKSVFFKETKARYDLAARFHLSSTPHPELEARLRADYVAMESMFFEDTEVPDFEVLLETLGEIDAAVAGWRG
jgi:hypothetical protein